MGYLGATLTRNGRVTQKCHKSPRWETGLQSAYDVTHRKHAGDLGNLKKVSRVELSPASEEDGWVSLARGGLVQVSHEIVGGWGCRWKSQTRKIVPLSLYVEKPLNWKVIKSFVPEQRSPKCFSCFEIPMFYVLSLWTLRTLRTSYVHFAYSCMGMLHMFLQAERSLLYWDQLRLYFSHKKCFAQSLGGGEYTDCISAEG